MKCEYCGTDEQKGKTCQRCGAKLPEANPDIWKSEPFFYNGYICYQFRDMMSEMTETQFWLGRELIERIKLPMDVIRHHVPEFGDVMPFIWDLFLLAQGEKEVLVYQEKNNIYPATFEVRWIENPDKEWMRGLSRQELLKAFIK